MSEATSVTGRLLHPGPANPIRRQVVRTSLSPVSGRLEPGETVIEGVTRVVSGAGCRGGVLFFEDGACDPFRYVLPALSRDPDHAAWYSETLAPHDGARFVNATATIGERNGAPFLHCHGLWDVREGALRMGHLLPYDSLVSTPVPVRGYGSSSASFVSSLDAETNFALFSAEGRAGDGGDHVFVRLRPEEDVCTAAEEICAGLGIERARIYGLGSICAPVFSGGRMVNCSATEVVIQDGLLERGSLGVKAIIDTALVDMDGTVHYGRLRKGDNPVAVTFELVIVNLDGR